ncbi:MAG: hypothetical protein SV375_15910, partial [Thermodesulfobacteriota bacterium]|nr:hypothetical protein [Thermodesulfobacteriota bacterium]
MRDKFVGLNLVFFDLDYMLEVKSKPFGRKDSSEYLYWNEMGRTFERGHSRSWCINIFLRLFCYSQDLSSSIYLSG